MSPLTIGSLFSGIGGLEMGLERAGLGPVVWQVEKDAYCIDVINQSLAVQSALKTASNALLKNHLETCVADAIKNGKTQEVITEVMQVVKKQ